MLNRRELLGWLVSLPVVGGLFVAGAGKAAEVSESRARQWLERQGAKTGIAFLDGEYRIIWHYAWWTEEAPNERGYLQRCERLNLYAPSYSELARLYRQGGREHIAAQRAAQACAPGCVCCLYHKQALENIPDRLVARYGAKHGEWESPFERSAALAAMKEREARGEGLNGGVWAGMSWGWPKSWKGQYPWNVMG